MRSFLKILFVLAVPFMLNANETDYAKTIQSIKDAFVNISALYQEGLTSNDDAKINEAKTATQNAYFQRFENVEA